MIEQAVSPEFRLRPSLSDQDPGYRMETRVRVAGVQTPAFVERSCTFARAALSTVCVAGVQTPAFVERGRCRTWPRTARTCRRSSDSGLR